MEAEELERMKRKLKAYWNVPDNHSPENRRQFHQ
jgi:hypothetical protein